ncbi:hypothetical protein FRAAL3446 [Frankia alni ACN14a]|uniref:Uncharacterized protein n=1 Tax=Frankia alni (strain DSM 45986 / CECT 9034 / ACN14a) TaxID=326424 RepID=Q0RK69_FRAAA|nr:hypothetical protein FRAAL3446 [Frankia alni ACN14a]
MCSTEMETASRWTGANPVRPRGHADADAGGRRAAGPGWAAAGGVRRLVVPVGRLRCRRPRVDHLGRMVESCPTRSNYDK